MNVLDEVRVDKFTWNSKAKGIPGTFAIKCSWKSISEKLPKVERYWLAQNELSTSSHNELLWSNITLQADNL